MRIAINRYYSFILLIGFLYVQVPFGIFHHHEHKPICELNEHTRANTPSTDSAKHFHENVDSPCFFCSAQLLKEYHVKDHTLSWTITSLETRYLIFSSAFASPSINTSSARAPPLST